VSRRGRESELLKGVNLPFLRVEEWLMPNLIFCVSTTLIASFTYASIWRRNRHSFGKSMVVRPSQGTWLVVSGCP